MQKYKRFILLFIFVALLIAGTLFRPQQNTTLAADITKCNTEAKDLRFSCYRSILETHYKKSGTDVAAFVKSIENNTDIKFENKTNSYAVFGTNCHSFYHALGDLVATHDTENDLATLLSYDKGSCTAGYTMGLYKRTALVNGFSSDVLKSFYEKCKKGQEHQCTHEIGHNLHDKYTYSILKVLDETTQKHYGLSPARSYAYTTYKENNLDAPFEECKKLVPEAELAYCYTGVGHNLFLFSEFSTGGYQHAFAECEKAKPEHKDDCYAFLVYRIGINDAGGQFILGNPEKGKAICNEVVRLSKREELMKHCYAGIGGGIGLFVDSEYANIKITEDNLASIQKEVIRYINLCEASDEANKTNCYKGLLGTKVKKLYKDLNIENVIIEELLPKSNDGFQVVG